MLPCEINFGLDSGDKNHKNQSRTGEPSDLIVLLNNISFNYVSL